MLLTFHTIFLFLISRVDYGLLPYLEVKTVSDQLKEKIVQTVVSRVQFIHVGNISWILTDNLKCLYGQQGFVVLVSL